MTTFRRITLPPANPVKKTPRVPLDEKFIPSGPFCHKQVGATTEPCPFWSVRKGEEVGEMVGACAFLKVDDTTSGVGLLKDGCKECGVRMDEEAEAATEPEVPVVAIPLSPDPIPEPEPAMPVCPVISLATRLAASAEPTHGAAVQVAFLPQASLFPEFEPEHRAASEPQRHRRLGVGA